MDNRALKTLLNVYSFYGERGFRPGRSKEFEYAKSAGYMFDNIRMTHDEGIAWLLDIRSKVSKQKVTDLFVCSLSTRRLDWRSGLAAYAIAQHFPDHKLDNKTDWGNYCRICGDHSYEINQERHLNLYNSERFRNGGYESMNTSPDALAFYLDQIHRLEPVKTNETDKRIISELIDEISNSEDCKSANDLERKLSGMRTLKSNKSERRRLLETLSLCGIIETKDHKGYHNSFIRQIDREKRPHGASRNDWCYPILWWKGTDGINKSALNYWLGGY